MKFKRQKHLIKKLKDTWRKPKGMHSKLRLRKRGKGRIVRIGYKKSEAKSIRLISSIKDLDMIIAKNEIIRLNGRVGLKKKAEIIKEAKKRNIKIVNVKDYDEFIKKVEDFIKKRKEKTAKEKEKKSKGKEEAVKKSEEKKEETKEEKVAKEKEDKKKVLEKK